MKKINSDSEDFFIKGFALYSVFNRATECDNIDDFLANQYTESEDKNRLWKVIQLFSLSVIIEHCLIQNINEQFEKFDVKKQDEIRIKIIKKITKTHKVSETDAEQMLNEQVTLFTGNISRNIINAPVIQYLAGYTMGSLMHFAENNFDISSISKKLGEFIDKRNYVMHNSTSSREDIDAHLKNGIEIGKEVLDYFNKEKDHEVFEDR